MTTVKDPARTRARLQKQLDRIAYLRGSGPNPFEYDQWQSRTAEVLDAIYGEDSEEVRRYQDEVGLRGRLPGVRGIDNNMTLNIHGNWGILGRLQRAERLLQDYVAALES